MMHYQFLKASDGTTLAFQTSQLLRQPSLSTVAEHHPTTVDKTTSNSPQKTCILLLHGFSGSSEYFKRNFASLSPHSLVIAPDMRGHGRSDRTKGGYHVARLASDLRDIMVYLRDFTSADLRIYVVGCSIGAAVLWTYIELFTNKVNASLSIPPQAGTRHTFDGMVFVDQAPLQDRSCLLASDDWDAARAHYGLYDEATLIEAQSAWGSDDDAVRQAAYRDLVESCLGYRYKRDASLDVHASDERVREDEEFFTGISAACDGKWLARLMADHTRYDHREAIEMIDVPVLVMMGSRSGCFPVDGMMETVRRMRHGAARASVYDCGHWLFYEDPDRFNRELLAFVADCESRKFVGT